MINIEREKSIPESLLREEIFTYLAKLKKYQADPEHNPKPRLPGTYRTSDLLDAFDRCFFSKCYLTEQKFENSYAMDVDHFIPQKERPDLVYDWDNLFPLAHWANLQKPKKTPTGGWMNPCDPADDVEKALVYSLSVNAEHPEFAAKEDSALNCKNTVALLDKIHNGIDEYSVKQTADLRHAIQKKCTMIHNKIIEWQGAGSNKAHIEQELKALLSRKSSFTMLCRSLAAVKLYVPQDFLD